MTHIFLLNGPPSSGKDTLAEFLNANITGGEVVKFARPIKDAVRALYCHNDQKLFDTCDAPENKNERVPAFHGVSCREAQIALSEQMMKPLHGSQIFGRILAQYIAYADAEYFFVSDSGFRDEALALIEVFKPENVTLIQIERDGFTFEGDSRSYIDLTDVLESRFKLSNNTTKDTFLHMGLHLVNEVLEIKHRQRKAS